MGIAIIAPAANGGVFSLIVADEFRATDIFKTLARAMTGFVVRFIFAPAMTAPVPWANRARLSLSPAVQGRGL